MKPSDHKSSWLHWLRRYWLLLIACLCCLLLGILWGIGQLGAFQPSAPIARIVPEDSLKTDVAASKLEGYRQEIEELQHQQYRQQQALEKIVAMDFAHILTEGGEEVPTPAERGSETIPATPPVPAIRNEVSTLPSTGSNPVLLAPAGQEVKKEEKEVMDSPFYTIRAENLIKDMPGENMPEKAPFYQAVIHGDQLLQPGHPLCLRLLDSLPVGEKIFPRNTLLYGSWEGSRQGRQLIRIHSIEGVAVKLRVVEQDGLEGLLSGPPETLPLLLAEGKEEVVDQLLYSVPYGSWLSGLTGLGKKLLKQQQGPKPLQLSDGRILYLQPDVSLQKPTP